MPHTTTDDQLNCILCISCCLPFPAHFLILSSLRLPGLLSGLVVDSGDGVSHAVAVVEGYVQPRATQRLNVAGRHVTARLLELLQR